MKNKIAMNRKKISALLLLPVLMVAGCAKNDDQALREAFTTPSDESRPRVWWHWEDGNVTIDGIRKDLEWMHRIGIGGFHHFDAALSTKPVVDKRLIYMDDGWREAFRVAIGIADSLGMEVGIASSPGWSSTGGPWVSKDDAMKRIVWSTADVREGDTTLVMAQPETNLDYYRDIAVVALPIHSPDEAVRAVKVLHAPYRSMWADLPATYPLVLEASDGGDDWHEVAALPTTTAGDITVNVPATTADTFRLRHLTDGAVPEYVLYHTSRVEHAEEKTGLSSPCDLADFPTVTAEGETFADVSETIDLTAAMDTTGRLAWTVPAGDWRIIRFGYTLTGKKNGPAPAEATGLEVDKFDPEAWNRYFHHYLDLYADASQGLIGQHGIEYLLVDSYEAHWQTWTSRMAEEFEQRRGYALLPWMPALSGEIIGSAEQTEQFLFDWRRTIGELYSENYARLQEYAREYNLKGVYLESQENGRVYVVDGMDVKRHATIPMAACWTPVDRPTDHSTIPMAIADMRESASVAHLYGKKRVATESFTADGWEGGAYAFTPQSLKQVADIEFASGVNQIFIHESSHQPLDDCRPGLGLLGYGQWFHRHETWAEQAKAWIDYMARTSSLLAQGENVADILVYYGEDTNITARYGIHSFTVPAGYNYDFINPTGLFDIRVKNGRIVAPSGVSYAVLCVDTGRQPASAEVTARLEALKQAGAVVCSREELSEVLRSVPADVVPDDDIRFVHRQVGRHAIYWINKPATDYRHVTLSLRVDDNLIPEVWDPVSGQMAAVPFHKADGRTVVELDMVPDDAQFVVFVRRPTPSPAMGRPLPTAHALCTLPSWSVALGDSLTLVMDSLQSYTESANPDVRYFSGTAVYRTTFSLSSVPADAVLSLGRVCDLAEVTLNGQPLGTLWKEPFALPVSEALREGSNELEVHVTNVWMNRLIGDLQPDCPHPTTYTSARFYRADSPLRPAGLLGPVVLVTPKQ